MKKIVKHVNDWFFNFLFGWKVRTGSLSLLMSGTESIKIDLPFTPREVWISLKEPSNITVCMGQYDSFECRIVPHGFVLIVTLNSDCREIEWMAIR